MAKSTIRRSRKHIISEPISIVAHQLKNPLYVIKVYLEALDLGNVGEVSEKQKEYLEVALENVSRMLILVGDLLTVSRIEENQFEFLKLPTDLVKITRSVVRDYSSWAKSLNCEIKFEEPQNLPFVYADAMQIRQVVENLISNAIKYKFLRRGTIKVKLAKRGGKVLFSCEDNGIGIPSYDLKKVFSKFYRSEGAVTLDPSGSGLGLYINKAIVEMSGGKIWFEKNKGRGLTFYFTLPIRKSK